MTDEKSCNNPLFLKAEAKCTGCKHWTFKKSIIPEQSFHICTYLTDCNWEPIDPPRGKPSPIIECEFAGKCGGSLNDTYCDSLDKEKCGDYQKFKESKPKLIAPDEADAVFKLKWFPC